MGRETEIGGPEGGFRTTLWTLVLQARDDDEQRRAALDRLFSLYWKPVYFYVRRKGNSVEDAKEIVQGFFASLVERPFLKSVTDGRGRFRAYLTACLKHYLCDVRDRDRALKRGGGRAAISLDFPKAEAEYPPTAADSDPQDLYDRAWAVSVLDRALQALRREYEESGRGELFDALKAFVAAGADGSDAYAAAASHLRLSESAVRVAVHRTRRRYRDLIRSEVAHTVQDGEDADEEISDLFRALAGNSR